MSNDCESDADRPYPICKHVPHVNKLPVKKHAPSQEEGIHIIDYWPGLNLEECQYLATINVLDSCLPEEEIHEVALRK